MPERYAAAPQLALDKYQYKTIQKQAMLRLSAEGTATGAFPGKWSLSKERIQ